VKTYPERVETEIHIFGKTRFAPCDACQAHKKLKGECRIQDGFQELRDKWLDADAIIYSASRTHKAELITSDQHLKGLQGVTFIG